LARRDTLRGFLEIVSNSEGVYLCDLPPCTSLLVWTLNSFYRMVIMQAPEVSVQGEVFFLNRRPPGWRIEPGSGRLAESGLDRSRPSSRTALERPVRRHLPSWGHHHDGSPFGLKTALMKARLLQPWSNR
jgi:hypothetical protein